MNDRAHEQDMAQAGAVATQDSHGKHGETDDPPRPAALSDTGIYERIIAAVLDHRLAPGTKLGEEKLGRAFGVSRQRIRQVLVRLAAEQVVVLTHNRGATVASPSPEEAREVFAARRLIEPTLLEAFIQVAREQDFNALTRIIDEEDAARREGHRRARIRLSGEFHLQIAERSRNRTLEKILRELVSRTSLILMTYERTDLSGTPHGGCASNEHRLLLNSIAARDTTEARRLMKRHLSHLEAHLDFGPPAGTRDDFLHIFLAADTLSS